MKTYWPVFRPSGLVLAAVMFVPHWTGAQTAKSATASTRAPISTPTFMAPLIS